MKSGYTQARLEKIDYQPFLQLQTIVLALEKRINSGKVLCVINMMDIMTIGTMESGVMQILLLVGKQTNIQKLKKDCKVMVQVKLLAMQV